MIIVSGIQRTGTSLMMEILGKNGFEILRDEMDFEKDEYFKKLQPNYNEHSIFGVKGLNKNTIKGNEKLLENKKLCCKLMGSSLEKTDTEGLKYIDKIIIMVRNWRDQTASWKPVALRNINNLIENNKKLEENILKITNIEEFKKDRLYFPGVLYAIEYTKILNFIIKYKVQKKCIFIDFDSLINNFKFISRSLQKPLKIKLKKYDLIKKNNSKFYNIKDVRYEEFREGFFKFLVKLENNLKIGNIDNNFFLEYRQWQIILNQYIIDKEIFTAEKYGFWLKNI